MKEGGTKREIKPEEKERERERMSSGNFGPGAKKRDKKFSGAERKAFLVPTSS